MYSVVFVCTGNTCRSPMAEAIARRLWGEGGEVEFRSAGMAAVEGAPASPLAIDVVGGEGLDRHRSRPAGPGIVDGAHLLVALSRGHRDQLLRLYPEAADRVVTLAELGGEEGDVPDPFGQDRAAYERAHARIEELLEAALPALRARAAAATRP